MGGSRKFRRREGGGGWRSCHFVLFHREPYEPPWGPIASQGESVPIFLMKPFVTCDFPRGVLNLCPPPPSGSAHASGDIEYNLKWLQHQWLVCSGYFEHPPESLNICIAADTHILMIIKADLSTFVFKRYVVFQRPTTGDVISTKTTYIKSVVA